MTEPSDDAAYADYLSLAQRLAPVSGYLITELSEVEERFWRVRTDGVGAELREAAEGEADSFRRIVAELRIAQHRQELTQKLVKEVGYFLGTADIHPSWVAEESLELLGSGDGRIALQF